MTFKLYIAGPLFTPYHRAFHADNVSRLRDAGYDCFVPQEQEHNALESASPAQRIFEVDMIGVRRANAIVALLDDPDVSSGTACEIGIFWDMVKHDPNKKGVLGLLTDERAHQRKVEGVPPVNAFTLGCILDIGCVYSTMDNVIEHLDNWREGRDMPIGMVHI